MITLKDRFRELRRVRKNDNANATVVRKLGDQIPKSKKIKLEELDFKVIHKMDLCDHCHTHYCKTGSRG